VTEPSSQWSPWAPAPEGPPVAPPPPPPPAERSAAPWGPPPLPPSPPSPPPDTGRSGRAPGTWRSALAGALAGALVAGLVAAGVVAADDDDDSGTVTRTVVAAPERLAGEALDIRSLLEKVQPSVVSIRLGASGRGGAGSGVVVSEDGLVVTNAHVVQGATAIEATLFDGTRYAADLVGSSPDDDIALIRLRDAEGLVPAELGDSDALEVGAEVVAIGNALNLAGTPTVTRGIVSAKDRSLEAPTGTFFGDVVRLENLIQTDAAINPGNSGGPLVDAAGRVVGINTAVAGGAQNIGFAIAMNAVAPLIEDLRNGGGEIRGRAFLGVSTMEVADIDPSTRQRYGVDEGDVGAFVVEVVPGSAAERLGLEPGDLIVRAGGVAIEEPEDLGEVLRDKQPGEPFEVTWRHAGEERTASADLGSRATGN